MSSETLSLPQKRERYELSSAHQRDQIERLITLGKKVSEIASLVGVHRSTVYREIERNSLEVGHFSELLYEAIPAIGITSERRKDGCEGDIK